MASDAEIMDSLEAVDFFEKLIQCLDSDEDPATYFSNSREEGYESFEADLKNASLEAIRAIKCNKDILDRILRED